MEPPGQQVPNLKKIPLFPEKKYGSFIRGERSLSSKTDRPADPQTKLTPTQAWSGPISKEEDSHFLRGRSVSHYQTNHPLEAQRFI
jgi:hypothetical protein